MGDTAGDPGARGVLLSVPLGLVAAVWLLGFATLEVDDRGKVLPRAGSNGFRGLYLATREALTGQTVRPEHDLGVSAVGAFWVAMSVIPLLVVVGVFVIFRLRRAQSTYWTVTIGMLLIAATVLLLGRIEYIGSMAALTWASFQIRRSELPGKMAEREAIRAARAEAAAAAAEEADDEDEYDEDEYDEDAEYEDEAYYEEDEDADAEGEGGDETDGDDAADDDAADDDETEYDEEADEDGYVDEDEADEADAEADDIDATAPVEDDHIVDYDEDVLKELEAEIDESEGRDGDGDGATKPGR